MDCQELTIRFEPARERLNISLAFIGLDGAEQRVLESPIKAHRSGLTKKIYELKLRGQTRRSRTFRRELDSARRDVVAEGGESSLCPGPDIVAGPATRHAYAAARQFRMRRQKINQPRRRRSFFPGHVV